MIICKNEVKADCETGIQKMTGEDWNAETCEGAGFLWTHAGASYQKGINLEQKCIPPPKKIFSISSQNPTHKPS